MIGIIDYGAGNTQSVKNALKRIDAPFFLSSDKRNLEKADKLILPGVGHAAQAMSRLNEMDLVDFITSTTKPFLGICLGMQLLAKFSEEGEVANLNVISETITKFPSDNHRVPKMGWNTLEEIEDNPLFKNISASDYFYFVHSYYMPSCQNTIAKANYNFNYSAAVQKDNFYGVQFHPEKSSAPGLQLLKNFITL